MSDFWNNIRLPFQFEFSPVDFLTYMISALILFAILFAGYAAVNHITRKWAKRSGSESIQNLVRNLRAPLILLVSIISLWLPFSFTTVPPAISNVAGTVLTILVIAVFAWIAIRMVGIIKYVVLSQYDIGQKDNLKARKVYTQIRILQRILTFIILIIAVSLALMTFSEIRRVGVSLIASAGVTGIIVGLAAQKIIGGVLAGILLAITQPIRIDDVVVVENEWGRIEEINLTYVVVRIWDQRRLVLPTTYFIENPFQNWTRTNADILGTVFIYTDYIVPVDKLRAELTRLLEANPLWDGKVNNIQVTNATEKTVEIRALMSAADSSSAWDLRVYVRENLIRFLQENYPESLPRSRVALTDESSPSRQTPDR